MKIVLLNIKLTSPFTRFGVLLLPSPWVYLLKNHIYKQHFLSKNKANKTAINIIFQIMTESDFSQNKIKNCNYYILKRNKCMVRHP